MECLFWHHHACECLCSRSNIELFGEAMEMTYASGLAGQHTCQAQGYMEVGLEPVEGYPEVG